jgi:hypothetical protein
MPKIPSLRHLQQALDRQGSRIETIPSPRLSARAASHSVWIAMAVEAWSVAGMLCRPSPWPSAGSVTVKTASCSGAASSPASFSRL